MLTPDVDEEKDVAATEFSVTTEDDEATDADGVDSAEYDQGLKIYQMQLNLRKGNLDLRCNEAT